MRALQIITCLSILLISLFPPRIKYVMQNRSVVLEHKSINSCDFIALYDAPRIFLFNDTHPIDPHEFRMEGASEPKTVYNTAKIDGGQLIAEVFLVLSTAFLISIFIKGKKTSKLAEQLNPGD